MEPIAVTHIAATLELDLQHVHGALEVTSTWRIRVFVVTHGTAQPLKQRLLQLVMHGVAHEGPHKNAEGEEEGTHDVRKHQELPAQELVGVDTVVADLAAQEVDAAGHQACGDEHVGHGADLMVRHQFSALLNLYLEKKSQAEEDNARHHRIQLSTHKT